MDQIDMTHRRWPFLTIRGPLTNRRALRVLCKARRIPPPGPCVHSGRVAAVLVLLSPAPLSLSPSPSGVQIASGVRLSSLALPHCSRRALRKLWRSVSLSVKPWGGVVSNASGVASRCVAVHHNAPVLTIIRIDGQG